MKKTGITLPCLLLFLLFCTFSNAQYNVIKLDVLGAATNQYLRPSFEHSFKNFSAVLTYEAGTYEEFKSTRNVNYDEVIYDLKSQGIIPELRYYPAHHKNIPPYGFFIGAYYSYKFLEEHYKDYGYDFTTEGNAWNAGISTGYKSSFGKRVIFEVMVGGGFAGGSFDEPNQRSVIDEYYKTDDWSAFYHSLRAEISIGFIFPKVNIVPKHVENPPSIENNSAPLLLNDSLHAFSDSSKIILYHPAKTFGSDYSYDVYLDDKFVYNAEWGTADTISVPASKEFSLSATTEEKESIYFTPEKNKIYFIRCSMRSGVLVGRPLFEFVNAEEAQSELKKIK